MINLETINCSTPSRICLFGEHLDYLGLEVIAAAIDLRFNASITARNDSVVNLKIRDKSYGALNAPETKKFVSFTYSVSGPIPYKKKRDYIPSVFNVLKRQGYDIGCGFDIVMDSTIPIGKGMCSSSTMILVLIKALLETIGHEDAKNPGKLAELAYLCEVAEFNEPGGKMDHYASAIGSLVHIDFKDEVKAQMLNAKIDGCFILFDTLQDKDTTKVLADSKIPVLEALDELKAYGITGVRDFIEHPEYDEYIGRLDDFHAKKLRTAISNYKILLEAKEMFLSEEKIDPEKLGRLLKAHHANLRDGLGISTPVMEKIFDVAYKNGALGGKLNGSGGGGCMYVYALKSDAEKIKSAVADLGYPGKILCMDTGVRTD